MEKIKRFAIMNKLFILIIGLIAFFGYLDVQQIKGVTDWSLYNQFTAPAFQSSWLATIIVIALVYYLFTKDKSEALALFLSAFIMIKMGLEDIFFFIFSPEKMTPCMSWFGPLQNTVSKYVLKETCVSPLGLVLNTILGIVIAYYVYKYLREKW